MWELCAGACSAQSEAAPVSAADRVVGVASYVREIARAVENRCAAGQGNLRPLGNNHGRTRQWNDDDLVLAGPQVDVRTRGEFEYPQAGFGPPGRLRRDHCREITVGGRSGGDVVLAEHLAPARSVLVDELDCGVDGRGHVAVGWVEQRAPDYQSAHGRQLKGGIPLCVR